MNCTRHILTRTFVLALALAGCVSLPSQRQGAPGTAPRNEALERQKAEAAAHGALWLIAHADTMPADFVLMLFRTLYRTAGNSELAEHALRIARNKERAMPRLDTAIDIRDERYLDWFVLRPVVSELLRKKCEGAEYRRDAAAVAGLLASRWDRIFPESMAPNQKIVAAFLLRELGIGRRGFYAEVRADIRSRVSVMDRPFAEGYSLYVYAITHIVLTESGYFGRYLDPAGFRLEVFALGKALDNLLEKQRLLDEDLDLAAEVLICLKLLGQPPDQRGNAMYATIASRQNPDGSWGNAKAIDSARVHNTEVATLALLPFAPQLRGKSIFCSTGEGARAE